LVPALDLIIRKVDVEGVAHQHENRRKEARHTSVRWLRHDVRPPARARLKLSIALGYGIHMASFQ
jgi:hypothetical protein